MTIEIICPDTGLQVYGTRETCERAIPDKGVETAYRCRYCGWWHSGQKITCPKTGKRCYATEASCERDIEKAWTDPTWKGLKHGRMPRRAYQCPHCHRWHMSTRSRSFEDLARSGHADPALPLQS